MRNYIKYLLTCLFLIGVFSCEDRLSLQDPTQITKDQALEGDGIEGVAISMYSSMQNVAYYGARMMIVGDVLADNVRANFLSNRYASEYDNVPGSHVAIYAPCYGVLSAANNLLANIANSEISDSRKRELEGEGKFVRALVLHDLVRTYGYEPTQIVNGWNAGVVVRTEPVERPDQADLRARETVTAVYAQIESDLLSAISLLNNDNPNYLASRGAAEALLSRVYLYLERYDDVITYATDAMNSGMATLVAESAYADAFHGQFNPEAFFELIFDSQETISLNSALAGVTTTLPTAWSDLVYTDDLLSIYDQANDVRYLDMTFPDNDFIYNNKYSGSADGNNVFEGNKPTGFVNWADNMPIIRYSEVLLNRAEAYAETGQEDLARADVNLLRANRGLAASPIGSTGATLTNDVLLERRRELAFEGHRWFDLKRRGMNIPKPQGNIPTIPYSNFRILGNLPNGDVDINPNLLQNPGY